MRALLAEADPTTRDQLRRLLSARGWDVCLVRTGAAAAEAFEAQPCALALLARDLPDSGGLDVCRAIRTSTLGRAAFVLLVTPHASPEDVRRMVAAGVDDYLLLPLHPTYAEGRIAFAECHLLADAGGGAAGFRTPSYPQRIAELEETLRVQRASLEELFQSAPEGVVVVDEDDRVLRVNAEFARMFGYAPEEALGRQINELIVPEHLQEQGLRLTRGVVRGERITVDTVRRHKDGRMIEVSVLATPIEAGGYIGAYGIYRDITERKAHERALRESAERYRALFDQSPVGVFLCDAELRITQCNERLPQIVRSTREEIVGMDLRRLRDERILPAVRQAQRGEPTQYEGPYQPLRGGPQLWISVHFAPLRDADGRIIGGTGVVEDVTERERAEQQLRAQAAELERVNVALRERTLELEAAMQARSRVYTAMNHELRTPISAIMLYQELLLTGAVGPLSVEQRDAVEHAQTAARHLLDLVRDVLDLSKLEAGRVRVQAVEVCIPTLLDDLRATVLPLAHRHGSEIVLDCPPALPPLITDPQRVRQILLNFVSNAAKFGRSRPIVLRARGAGDEIVLEVEDRGIGIAEADLPHIFEDFVQVGGQQEGGTGLGLAISRRLAELLHGRLEVESQPGVGSTFRLVVPRVLSESAPVVIDEPA